MSKEEDFSDNRKRVALNLVKGKAKRLGNSKTFETKHAFMEGGKEEVPCFRVIE